MIAVSISVCGISSQADCEDWPYPQDMRCLWRADLCEWDLPSRLVYLLKPSFGCTTYGSSQVLLSKCVGSVAPWERLPSRPSSEAAFDCLRLPGRIYKAICGWLLPVLDLKESGRDYTAYCGVVTLITEPGAI